MKRVLRWIALVVGGIVALAVLAVLGLYTKNHGSSSLIAMQFRSRPSAFLRTRPRLSAASISPRFYVKSVTPLTCGEHRC
jgi:hypothetical protein